MNTQKDFSEIIKIKLKENGTTISRLCREIYISQSTLSNYLNCKRRIPLETAEEILNYFGLEFAIKKQE